MNHFRKSTKKANRKAEGQRWAVSLSEGVAKHAPLQTANRGILEHEKKSGERPNNARKDGMNGNSCFCGHSIKKYPFEGVKRLEGGQLFR